MNKSEIEKMLTAYLEEKDPDYNDIISTLNSTIQGYYEKKKQEEENKEKLREARIALSINLIEYFQLLLGKELTQKEKEEGICTIVQILKELEPSYTAAVSEKGDIDFIKNFTAGIL
jgi:hypothetical protein